MCETESRTSPHIYRGITARYPPGCRVPAIIHEQVVIREKKEWRKAVLLGLVSGLSFRRTPFPFPKFM